MFSSTLTFSSEIPSLTVSLLLRTQQSTYTEAMFVFLCLTEQNPRRGVPEDPRTLGGSLSWGRIYEAQNANSKGKFCWILHNSTFCLLRTIHTYDILMCHFQKYQVRMGNDIVEKIHKFMHKVTTPLRPKVGINGTENEKHLSYPFSREKQHL